MTTRRQQFCEAEPVKSSLLGPQSEHASILRRKANGLLLSPLLAVSVALVAIGCQPSLSSSSPETRLRAVREVVTDQAVLARVAVEDQDEAVRILAVANLTDQGLLAQIAMDDWPRIGRVAVEKLTDQGLLAQVAKDGHYNVQGDARRRLEFLRSSEKEPQLEQRN